MVNKEFFVRNLKLPRLTMAQYNLNHGSSPYRYFWGGPKACFLVVATRVGSSLFYGALVRTAQTMLLVVTP